MDPEIKNVLIEDLYPILKFFEFDHLPKHLSGISEACSHLAHQMATMGSGNNPAETLAGLRKLLEAKDCFVRAAL